MSGENNKILITNIQRFSLHDGPGIRTTIFLKGCTLRCPWCSNPENLISKPEPFIKDGISGGYGIYMSCEEVFQEVMKDKAFYISGQPGSGFDSLPGGVTFSGGEALLQINKLVPLLERLKKEELHIAVETSLFVSSDKIEIAMRYFDMFYVDMKILSKELCRDVEHGDLDIYLQNLDKLFASDIPIIIRIPVIGGYTDANDNRKKVIRLLEKYKPKKVELIKEHNLGMGKYVSLSIPVPEYTGVSDDLMEDYRAEIEKVGVPVEIYRI